MIKDILSKNKLPILTMLAAIVLRFYKIGPFTIFLSDQGRDAVIVKRIVTLEHLPAIGPPTSIGHVFLGPFYYYLIAPFLWLARLNPIGMSVGMAILSVVGLFACYLIARKEYNKKIADLFLIFSSFSFISIDYSRFSWNPNPLPFFSFITIYFATMMFKSRKILYGFLMGSFLALSIQLHYLAILLALPIGIAAIYSIVKNKQRLKTILTIGSSILGFIFFSSPLILFDLKHQFINSKSLIALFQKERVVTDSSFTSRFQDTVSAFFQHILQIPISHVMGLFLLVSFIGMYLFLTRRHYKMFDLLHAGNIVCYLLGFGLLQSYRHPHYYMNIYFSLFFIGGIIFYNLYNKNLVSKLLVTILLFSYIGINAKNYYYFTREPNNQVKHAQTVANFLAPKINNKPYNIATWPIDFTEDNYLYFLELRGLVPADREKVEVTDQMFVLCNTAPCSIINSPSWNISMFGKAKVAEKWEIERIKIYKLVHDI